jgi:hypothetical protein
MDSPPSALAGSPGPGLVAGLGDPAAPNVVPGTADSDGAADGDVSGDEVGEGSGVAVAGAAVVGVGAIVGAGVGTAVTVIETTRTGLRSVPSDARYENPSGPT